MERSIAAFVLSLGLAACAAPAPSAAPAASAEPAPSDGAAASAAPPAEPMRAGASAVRPLDKKKFGGDVTEKTPTALDDLVKEPSKFADKTVRTEGMVFAVCEHKGCWMEIADDSGKAHIKMAGHAFFVPREIRGHRAAVQGKVIAPDKDHCTEEAEAQTGGIAKVQIEANAIEVLD